MPVAALGVTRTATLPPLLQWMVAGVPVTVVAALLTVTVTDPSAALVTESPE